MNFKILVLSDFSHEKFPSTFWGWTFWENHHPFVLENQEVLLLIGGNYFCKKILVVSPSRIISIWLMVSSLVVNLVMSVLGSPSNYNHMKFSTSMTNDSTNLTGWGSRGYNAHTQILKFENRASDIGIKMIKAFTSSFSPFLCAHSMDLRSLPHWQWL